MKIIDVDICDQAIDDKMQRWIDRIKEEKK